MSLANESKAVFIAEVNLNCDEQRVSKGSKTTQAAAFDLVLGEVVFPVIRNSSK
jgi:hypothetical protein